MKRLLYPLFFLLLMAHAYALSAAISSPASGTTLAGSTNTVTVDITEGGDTVDKLYLEYRNTSTTDPTVYLIGMDSTQNQTQYQLTFDSTPYADTAEGYLQAIATNNSEAGENVSSSFLLVKVNNTLTNSPPSFTAIPSLTWAEDSSTTLNLSLYASDPDNNSLTFTASPSTTNIIVTWTSDLANLSAAADFQGTATLTFTAHDGTESATSSSISLNITAVNDAPTLSSPLKNATWTQDTVKKISLGEHFTDADGGLLTFTSSSLTSFTLRIENETGDVTLTPASNFTGSETVTFTAYDATLLSVTSNPIVLTVIASEQPSNLPPVIASSTPSEASQTLALGSNLTFSLSASDPEGLSLSYHWTLDGTALGSLGPSYAYAPTAAGTSELAVTVTDGTRETRQVWTVVTTSSPSGPSTPSSTAALCGNKLLDANETCSSCPQDVTCPKDFQCVQGTCRKTQGTSVLLWVILGGTLALVALAVFLFLRRTASPPQEEDLFLEEPFRAPPIQPSQAPAKPPTGLILPPKTSLPDARRTVSTVLLETYIQESLARKKPWDLVKRNLLKAGWTETQVMAAYQKLRRL